MADLCVPDREMVWGGGGGAAVTAAPGGMRLWPPPRHELAPARCPQSLVIALCTKHFAMIRLKDEHLGSSGCCNKGTPAAPVHSGLQRWNVWVQSNGIGELSARIVLSALFVQLLNTRILCLQRRIFVQSNGMRTFSKSFLCFLPRLHMYCYNPTLQTEQGMA
jgi:hypothetical protein